MADNTYEDEVLDSSELEEPIEEPQDEGVIDSVSRTATHEAGKAAATAYGGAVGRKLYEAASNTRIGQAIEEQISKRTSFRIRLILLGVAISFFFLFFVIISVVISNDDTGLAESDSCIAFQASCDNKAAQQLAKIVYHEVGNQDLFTQLTTASIVLNNAKGGDYQSLYSLTDNQYAGYSGYRSIDFKDDVPDSHKGKMLYVAEVVLSQKYNLPENMHLQASKDIVISYGKIWTYTPTSGYDVYFGYVNGDLYSKDVFGNSLPDSAYSSVDSSVQYYKNLAKELELSDYSGYTTDKVCANIPSVRNICTSITPSGYATVSVDEYVAGVIKAEIGSYVDPNFNTYKSLAVAARSYALAGATKNSDGSCTVPVGPSFQAYSNTPNEDMLKAAKDTSGIILTVNNNVYSAQYDALCIDSSDSTNYYLCQGGKGEEHMILPKDWIVKKTGQAYIDYISQYTHGHGLSQNGAWYLALERNWDYTKILDYFYGDEGAALASTTGTATKCTDGSSGSFQPLEEYNLRHAGLSVLNRSLNESELNDLNKYISDEINKAGFGTGAGVAAAGQALTYWLEQKGYYLQYRWGGKYSYVGASPDWGSTKYGTDYNNASNPRPYYGMDCTGFTSWAITNACKPSGRFSYSSWYNELSGAKNISLSEAKPGDVLENDVHIQLVVKNNGDGSVIVAEETGGSTSGLVFTHITSLGDYVVTDMSGYYKNNCESR